MKILYLKIKTSGLFTILRLESVVQYPPGSDMWFSSEIKEVILGYRQPF